jgi:hypothetical protein
LTITTTLLSGAPRAGLSLIPASIGYYCLYYFIEDLRNIWLFIKRIYLVHPIRTNMFLFDEEESNNTYKENKTVTSKDQEIQEDVTGLPQVQALEAESGEGTGHPLPEELSRTRELPLVDHPDLAIQSQQVIKKEKAKEEEKFTRLCNQLSKHLEGDKTIDTLRQIQKKLKQIDKMAAISAKQHIILKRMAVQVGRIRKQLDKISISINRFKNTSGTNTKSKGKDKGKAKGKSKDRNRSK